MPRFRVARDEGIVRVVMDDGGMNLLSSDALQELREICEGEAAGTTLFVLSSARPRLFAAGADMAEMQRFSPYEAEAFARLGQETFERIERMPCVTVVSIDGDCFGGALDLALAFDFRFATGRSRFSHPGARIGIVTGFGGTSRWAKALTPAAAKQLFLANRVLAAPEARELGLVDRVGEEHEGELARLAALDPARVAMVKELTIRGARMSRAALVLLARALSRVHG